MNSTPDFYDIYRLDRNADSGTLGYAVSVKQGNAAPGSSDARALEVAYAVLSNPKSRDVYDRTLAIGEFHSWEDLEYLGNFGSYPFRGAAPQQPQSQQPPVQAPVQPPTQQQPHFGNPFDPNYSQGPQVAPPVAPPVVPAANYQVSRPNEAALRLRRSRLIAAIIDFFLAAILVGLIAGDALPASYTPVLSIVVAAVYLIGFEVGLGATPGKLMLGLKVRDPEGKKPTWRQAALRNWWKIIGMTGLGSIVGLIVGGLSYYKMGQDPEGRGHHDLWGDTRVERRE